MSLQQLNDADEARAIDDLSRCCGSRHWAREMAARRPYASLEELQATAEQVADSLTRDDWLEAFSHHPRIGERQPLRTWESGEQAGVRDAGDGVLARLEVGNRAYEQRFGFVFLVCATGKSADEMLALLESRSGNDPAQEWRVAAQEQRKITQLRLRKLVEGDRPT